MHGRQGVGIIPIALAPIFGHAYSPFLKFQGGKALAVSLGVWIGLLLWKAPFLILLPLTLVFLVVGSSLLAVLASMAVLGGYLLFVEGNPYYLVIFISPIILLLWKHRYEFRKPINLREWQQKRVKND